MHAYSHMFYVLVSYRVNIEIQTLMSQWQATFSRLPFQDQEKEPNGREKMLQRYKHPCTLRLTHRQQFIKTLANETNLLNLSHCKMALNKLAPSNLKFNLKLKTFVTLSNDFYY